MAHLGSTREGVGTRDSPYASEVHAAYKPEAKMKDGMPSEEPTTRDKEPSSYVCFRCLCVYLAHTLYMPLEINKGLLWPWSTLLIQLPMAYAAHFQGSVAMAHFKDS